MAWNIAAIVAKIKARPYVSTGILLLILLISYKFYTSQTAGAVQIKYVTGTAQKTTLIKGIDATGQVAQLNKLDIKATGSGQITSIPVKQGQMVKKGQVIAVLDQRSNYVSLTQAKASLANAQANYEKLLAGATTEDIQLAQLAVKSAELSLANAEQSYETTKQQQEIAIKNSRATILNSTLTAFAPANNLTTATVTIGGSYTGTDEGQYKISLYQGGDGVHYLVSGLEQTERAITPGLAQPLGNHGLTITFSTTGTLVPGSSWIVNLPNTQASNYASNLNAYQSALVSQTQALYSAQAAITSAKNSLEQQKVQLALKIAAAAPADVNLSYSQVQIAAAQVASAQAAISANVLTAPFDGQIAAVNLQVGEQASGIIATLITNQKIATLSLNEVDITKIKLGDKASLSFDAIDGLTISGEIAQIDTLGTVSQGVVNYVVKIGFDTQDERVKPGMSANASIILEAKPGVLAVPSSAVKSDTSGSYVQQLDADGVPKNIPVTTGLITDTQTEIVSGLQDGDTIITQTIKVDPKAAAAAAATKSANPFSAATGGGARGGRN
jgi:RND family efflux transporter MFP subunit